MISAYKIEPDQPVQQVELKLDAIQSSLWKMVGDDQKLFEYDDRP